MICTLSLTILVLGKSFVVERSYEGNLIRITPQYYEMDFSPTQTWMDKPLKVEKKLCTKAS